MKTNNQVLLLSILLAVFVLTTNALPIGFIPMAAAVSKPLATAIGAASTATSTIASASTFTGTAVNSKSQKTYQFQIEIEDRDSVTKVPDTNWILYSTYSTDTTRATVSQAETTLRDRFSATAVIDDNDRDETIILKYGEFNVFSLVWQFKIRFEANPNNMILDVCYGSDCAMLFKVEDGGTRIKMSVIDGTFGPWEFYMIGSCDLDTDSPDKCIANGRIRPIGRRVTLSTTIDGNGLPYLLVPTSSNEYVIESGYNTYTTVHAPSYTGSYDHSFVNTASVEEWKVTYAWQSTPSNYLVTIRNGGQSTSLSIDAWARNEDKKTTFGGCFVHIRSAPENNIKGALVTSIACP